MKKSIPVIALLCVSVILLNSCSISKNSIQNPAEDVKNSSEVNSSCYVIMTDGSTRHYSTLKLVTGVLTTPHLLADNKVIIDAKDVMVYQDNYRYAVSQKLLTTKKISYVAKETLPGFAVRIKKGKLNVYCRKYYNGNTTVKEYFLQSGDEGEIIAYTAEALSSLVKDNQKALDFYNSHVKISPKSKKLIATADIYNSSPLLSKN